MTPRLVDVPVRVRVPATSANLGPGFDALGLALTLYDELECVLDGPGLRIQVDGEGGELVALDETHLVVRAMRRTFAELGVEPTGLTLGCTNRIPHGRGLGSSAAAIVGGVLLARALVADGTDRLTDPDVLALAAELEGHPDNVAPCLLGGLTVAWLADAARAVRRDVDPRIVPVALVPPFNASTEAVRKLLPSTVPHADAARNAGRSALLVAALTGDSGALMDATEDCLHQPFRASAMPASAELMQQLRASGSAAVISGAGPSVLVLARSAAEAERVGGLTPEGWRVLPLAVCPDGATRIA
jgi:homoserine kinase